MRRKDREMDPEFARERINYLVCPVFARSYHWRRCSSLSSQQAAR